MYIDRLYCDRKQMAICYVIWIADADIHVRVAKSTNTYNMGSCLIFCVCFYGLNDKIAKG